MPFDGTPEILESSFGRLELETKGESIVIRYWPNEEDAVGVAAVTMTSVAGAGGFTRYFGLGVSTIAGQLLGDGREQKPACA